MEKNINYLMSRIYFYNTMLTTFYIIIANRYLKALILSITHILKMILRNKVLLVERIRIFMMNQMLQKKTIEKFIALLEYTIFLQDSLR